jgi:hypothetical protein
LNLKPQNSKKKEDSQISCHYLKNTKNTKTTKKEGLPTGLEGQDHQEKRHNNLMCDSQLKSRKEMPPKFSHENPQKGSENYRKRKMGSISKSQGGHKDELQILHSPRGKILYKEASNLPSSYPLEDFHEALASSMKVKERGKTMEQNELGYQEMAAILSIPSLYGDNRKTKLPLLHNTKIRTPEGHFGNF